MKLALTLALACSAYADDLVGHYYLQNVHEVGSELLLLPNGTFEFMLAYGAADYHAKGAWRRDDDAVLLNSIDNNDPPFRLTRSLAGKGEGIRIWVKAPNGAPVEHIDVMVKTAAGEVKGRTTQEGVVWFGEAQQPRQAFFSVRVYDLNAGPFALNPQHNEFYFEINGDAITQTPFKDERLKIEGKPCSSAAVTTHQCATSASEPPDQPSVTSPQPPTTRAAPGNDSFSPPLAPI